MLLALEIFYIKLRVVIVSKKKIHLSILTSSEEAEKSHSIIL